MGQELGVGYVSLVVSTKGLGKDIAKQFGGAEKIAGQSGRSMGSKLKDEMNRTIRGSKPDFSAMEKAVHAAEGRMTAFVRDAAREQADAKRQVEIAQKKLNEVIGKSGKDSAAAASAQDKLILAQRKLADSTDKAKDEHKRLGGAVDAARKELDEAKSSASKTGGVFSRLGKQARDAGQDVRSKLGGALKGVGGLAAGAVAAIGGIGVGAVLGDAVKQAGDLEQSVGAVQAVFKGQAGQMMGWAKEAATAVGLSRNEYQELATVLGAQLKNGGTALEEIGGKTNNLIGLGADLASMFGGTTKEAVEAMTSALRGETDPIERYGVSVNAAKVEAEALAMGAEKVNGEFSQQAKQAAILSLITKQTADAQGNFAREADTFAGKQQRMSAQWQDLKAKMGELFLPTLSSVMGFVTKTAMPGLETFIGGLRAFGEAWKANDGDVTSSGFAGFMERFANKLRDVQEFLAPVGRWLQENKGIWGPFAAGVGLVTAGFAAWSVAAWAVGGAIAFITSPITLTIAGISLLVGALIYAYRNFEWFRNGVDAVWAWIKDAAAAVVSWFVTTALPWIQNALRLMGDAFSWLYNNIIKPVWNGIRVAIAIVVGTIMTLWDGVKWYINNVLGPVFTWLYNNVIKPVWDRISGRISAFSAWFSGVLLPAVRNVLQWAGDKFSWLWTNIIRPVWDNISSKIGNAWSFLRDRVFNPLISVVRDKVGPAFNAAKDAVKTAWDKIQDIVKKPVKFVIDTVINGALIKNINKVLEGMGMDPLAEVSSGFYNGGYTGNIDPRKAAGVVHGDEHVIRSKSRRSIEKTNPGLLDAMNKYGAKAFGMAAGGPGGPGSGMWGPLQDRIYASGVAHVSGSAPGYDLRAAARAWNNIGNLAVRYGSGPNQIRVGSGAPAGTWGYAWTDGRIQLNPGIPGNMKTGVAAHEIGHVLGLGHAGTNSIMHPQMRGPLWPSAFDRSSIHRIYGGSGKGNPPEGGGGGILGWITDKLTSGVDTLIDSIGGKFPGIAGDIASGVGKFLLGKGKDWVTSIWDDPVGTVQPLRPGYSTIYNGTGGTEFFQRVQPGGGGEAVTVENIRAAIDGMPVHMQTNQGVVLAKLVHQGERELTRR